MEKYAVEDNDLIEGLRNEEHELMLSVSKYLGNNDKTAHEDQEFRRLEMRLQSVRNKITEHDLKNLKING